MPLTIQVHGSARYAKHLKSNLLKAHRMLRQSRLRELSVAIVKDREMMRLHEHFLGLAEPTDVLSFELETDPRRRATAGEIVIDLDEARRSARKIGNRLQDELLLYALHGILHLSGYDDRTASGYRQMHRMEDQILEKLGIGRVFAPHRSLPGTGEDAEP